LFKCLHLAGVIGFLGGLAVMLTLSLTAQETTSEGQAVMRRAIAVASGTVAMPSLLLLLLSGMFSVLAHKPLFGARWVWAKAALGVVVACIALLVVAPAVGRAEQLAGGGAFGNPMFGALEAAVRQERLWGAAALLAGLAAAALGVWRPRLGRRDE
jgi:hypothetical protein